MAFRSRRQARYNKLISYGMLPFEAQAFSSVPFAHATFIRDIVRDRANLLESLRREAEAMGWSRARYEEEKRRAVAFEYKDKGLVFTKRYRDIIRAKGRADPWQLFREYRADAIRKGKWKETPRRRRRKQRFDERGIRIDNGDIAKQKARRRERERERRARESQ